MKLTRRLGVVAFWVCWPGLWLYLHFSRRTRVLMTCDDKVLVVMGLLGDNKWSLPGGGLHAHETAVDGAVREVREETGVQLSSGQLLLLAHERFSDKKLSFDCFYFFTELLELPTLHRQRGEIAQVTWLDRQALNSGNAGKDVLRALSIHLLQ